MFPPTRSSVGTTCERLFGASRATPSGPSSESSSCIPPDSLSPPVSSKFVSNGFNDALRSSANPPAGRVLSVSSDSSGFGEGGFDGVLSPEPAGTGSTSFVGSARDGAAVSSCSRSSSPSTISGSSGSGANGSSSSSSLKCWKVVTQWSNDTTGWGNSRQTWTLSVFIHLYTWKMARLLSLLTDVSRRGNHTLRFGLISLGTQACSQH